MRLELPLLLAGIACGPAEPSARNDTSEVLHSGIMAQVEAAERRITWLEDTPLEHGAWQARSRTGRVRAWFDESSAVLSPRSAASWMLTFRADRLDCGGTSHPLGAATPSIDGGHIAWDRGPAIEWYDNGEAGLEHGFTIPEQPPGCGGELSLHVATDGQQDRVETARGLRFVAGDGAPVVQYDGLVAWDADGRALDARLEPTEDGFEIHVDAGEAAWPVTVDPLVTVLRTSISGAVNEDFGYSVSLGGDVAAVGAPGSPDWTDVGHVYVLGRNQGGADAWGIIQTIDGGAAGFGKAVAINSGGLIISNPDRDFFTVPRVGGVQIHLKNEGGTDEWGIAFTGLGFAEDNQLGREVAIFRNMVAYTGHQEAPLEGNVYIMDMLGLDVVRVAADPGVPTAINLDAEFLVVATDDTVSLYRHLDSVVDLLEPIAEWPGSGVVDVHVSRGRLAWSDADGTHVHERHAGGVDAWAEVALLAHSGRLHLDVDLLAVVDGGTNIYTREDGIWAFSDLILGAAGDVSLEGNLMVVGSGPRPRGVAGSARFFEQAGDRWDFAGVVADVDDFDAELGHSIAVSDDTMVVGAPGDDLYGVESGAVHIFERSGGVWDHDLTLAPDGLEAGDRYGHAVALDGDQLVVGIPGWDGYSGTNDGLVRIHERNDGGVEAWGPRMAFEPAHVAVGEELGFGEGVAIDPPLVLARSQSHAELLRAPMGLSDWQSVEVIESGLGSGGFAGGAVEVDGMGLMIGEPSFGGDTGRVQAYLWDGGSDVFALGTIEGTTGDFDDRFGTSISLDGVFGVIGAPGSDNGAVDGEGRAEVIQWDGSEWVSQVTLRPPVGGVDLRFGESVAILDGRAWVGQPTLGGGAGQVHVFGQNMDGADAWGGVATLEGVPSEVGDGFGTALSASGRDIAVSAPGVDQVSVFEASAHVAPVAVDDEVTIDED